MKAIEAIGLTKSFGVVRALDTFDLTVPAGTICALLGPNGAGKTTAIRILATLISPDAGTASVAGFDTSRQAALVRGCIGLAGQHAAVDDDLTGRENLAILGLMHHLGRRAAWRRADELLACHGLTDAAGRLVKSWSGGMRRRLDLLASLIVKPAVLFLDEPTTGVDPRSRAAIWSEVRSLAASGTTVLLTTQYLDEADRLADGVVIIEAGRTVATGSPDDLKDTIGTRVAVAVEHAADLPAAAAVAARWATRPPAVDTDQLRVTARIAAGSVTLPELVRHLDAAGVRAQDVSFRRPTLDEVFLDRTWDSARDGAGMVHQ
ncbi:MAG TPA: ATP-binding cassette domain-containing protein [Streptosporangiaceae bacterium]|nr:ATP-binding cassette domain-containing protein [Streptosporangiaceae bacterium]